MALLAVALPAASVSARDVRLVLLHTTDLHGHLETVRAAEGGGDEGGLLRCATLIRSIREREPNVLLVDGGDLIQGAAESYRTKGDAVMAVVNHLRYDALVPGNHDFDWGAENLRRVYGRAAMPVVCANLAGGAEGAAWASVRPFVVREVAGVRVALVGLTTPLIPRWLRPRLLDDARTEGSLTALRRVVPYVREQKPDVWVLIAHQGYRQWGDDAANEINAIARAFPEFDVILGGHTHQAVAAEWLNGVLYAQAGCHGRWLGQVRLTVDTAQQGVKDKQATLIPVDQSVAADAEARAVCADALADARAYLSQTVGRADGALPAASRFPGQSAVQTLIARAIAEAAQADVVLHGVLSAASLQPGRITMRDLWRLMPYENTIGVARLTLDEVRLILEENSQYWNGEHFLGVYGLTYDLDPRAAAGARVTAVRLHPARKSEPGERLRVAFNSFDLASGGNRYPRLREIVEQPAAQLEETDIETRAAVLDYLRAHDPVGEQPWEGARLVASPKGVGAAKGEKKQRFSAPD